MSESQTPESQESPEETTTTNSGGASGKNSAGGCLGVIIGLVAVSAVSVFLLNSCSAERNVSEHGEQTQVLDVCHEAAEKQLKDPSSAEYSAETATLISSTDIGGEWKAEGTIRSRNSFGGMAVSSYTCDATYTKSGEEYRASAVVF